MTHVSGQRQEKPNRSHRYKKQRTSLLAIRIPKNAKVYSDHTGRAFKLSGRQTPNDTSCAKNLNETNLKSKPVTES